nr:sine oculis-binding protein homolog [Meriones unguiculatus]
MATRDPRTPVHTDTQVLAETPLAGKEVGPSGAWAGPAHPSARGAPSCSDHALCPQPSAANPAAPRPRPAPHSSESSTYVPTSPWPVLLGLCLSPPDAAAEGPALRTPTRCSPRRFPSCLDPHLLSRSWRPLVSTLRAPLLPAVGVRGSRALCGPDSPRSSSFTGIKLHPPATNLKGDPCERGHDRRLRTMALAGPQASLLLIQPLQTKTCAGSVPLCSASVGDIG